MSNKWYGWQLGNTVLHVGPLAARKQIALYLIEGNEYTPLAYFVDEEAAKKAQKFIDHMGDWGKAK